MTILRANQDIIGLMIFGAVFERHPPADRVRRGRRGLGAALDVPRRSRLRPSPQLADGGGPVTGAERAVPRARVPHLPGRLGRVPDGRPDEHRAAHVGQRLPAQRRDLAPQSGDARRARGISTTTSGRASSTTTSRSSTASTADAAAVSPVVRRMAETDFPGTDPLNRPTHLEGSRYQTAALRCSGPTTGGHMSRVLRIVGIASLLMMSMAFAGVAPAGGAAAPTITSTVGADHALGAPAVERHGPVLGPQRVRSARGNGTENMSLTPRWRT